MTSEYYVKRLSETLGLPIRKIENTLKLLEEGATIPFIARYRKEVTGSLDEVQIAAIQIQYNKLVEFEKRKESIIKSITEQGKMTGELIKRIESADDLPVLEDIYLPFKQKRKTRASMAREKGLEPLADLIVSQKNIDLESAARVYLNDKVASVEDALQGARDIIAERISEDQTTRTIVRAAFSK